MFHNKKLLLFNGIIFIVFVCVVFIGRTYWAAPTENVESPEVEVKGVSISYEEHPMLLLQTYEKKNHSDIEQFIGEDLEIIELNEEERIDEDIEAESEIAREEELMNPQREQNVQVEQSQPKTQNTSPAIRSGSREQQSSDFPQQTTTGRSSQKKNSQTNPSRNNTISNNDDQKDTDNKSETPEPTSPPNKEITLPTDKDNPGEGSSEDQGGDSDPSTGEEFEED